MLILFYSGMVISQLDTFGEDKNPLSLIFNSTRRISHSSHFYFFFQERRRKIDPNFYYTERSSTSFITTLISNVFTVSTSLFVLRHNYLSKKLSKLGRFHPSLYTFLAPFFRPLFLPDFLDCCDPISGGENAR